MRAFFSHRRTSRTILWFGYWIALIAVAVALKWGHLVNQDEGYTLFGAWQVVQGLSPYRDFFENITPGSLYLLAPVLWLFGPSYAAAKIFSIALLVFGCGGLLRVGGYLNLGRARYAVPVVWLLLSDHYVLINHNTFALVFAIWAIERAASVGRSAGRHGMISPAVAGLACAATVWMHQARGLAVVVAVAWYLATVSRRAILPFAVGLVIGMLPMLAWPLPLLWENLFNFSFQYYLPFNRTGPWWLAAVLAGYLLLYGALARFRTLTREEKFVWLSGVLLAASNFSQADHFHLLPVLFPMAVLCAVWYREVVRAGVPAFRRLAAFGITSAIAILAFVSLGFFAHRVAGVGWVAFFQLRDPQLEQLVSYIQTNVKPDQPIFVAPYLPNLYFEAQRQNPTRYRALRYGQHPLSFFQDARRSLETNPPPIVLLNYYTTPEGFKDFMVGNPVTDFIRQSYGYVTTINGVQVYRRRLPDVDRGAASL
ncbi:MAG: hypothetical protein PHI63_01365 [Patescibacteria group bacterium]|nr:hypothetical protein [Patescibacteria group bacterium]